MEIRCPWKLDMRSITFYCTSFVYWGARSVRVLNMQHMFCIHTVSVSEGDEKWGWSPKSWSRKSREVYNNWQRFTFSMPYIAGTVVLSISKVAHHTRRFAAFIVSWKLAPNEIEVTEIPLRAQMKRFQPRTVAPFHCNLIYPVENLNVAALAGWHVGKY